MGRLVDLARADVADGVRVLTLNDPDKRNAMSVALLTELGDAVDEVAADTDARVLVVRGNGSAFSAGADLPGLFGADVPDVRTHLMWVYDAFLRVRRLSIPTIAAVHGPAVGAGVNLAMSCDVRIAGPRARLGVSFVQLGLHPGGGCTWFLTRALGRQRALTALLDGETFDAQTALSLELVREIVDDPFAVALDTAGRWAALDPVLARDIKRTVGIAEHAGFDDTLEVEASAQAASTRSPLLQQAIARFRRD